MVGAGALGEAPGEVRRQRNREHRGDKHVRQAKQV